MELKHQKGITRLGYLSIIMVVLFLLFLVGFWNTLFPFTLGVILAFLLDPLVLRIQSLKIPRPIAIIFVTLTCILIFIFLLGFVFPSLISGLISSIRALLVKFQSNKELMDYINAFLEKYKIHVTSNDVLRFVVEKLNPILGHAVDYSVSLVKYILQSLKIWILAFLTLAYILLDKKAILLSFMQIIPVNQKHTVLHLYKKIIEQIYQFIVSLFIVSVIVFIITWIFLQFFHDTPSPFALALGSGILCMIPFLGGILPPIFIFLVQIIYATSFNTILWVLFIEIILFSFIGLYLQPMMTGRKVKIHPLIILICIIIGGEISGVFGVLLSVPTYIIIRTLFAFFLEKYKKEEGAFGE